jgi:hypothetical protein
MYKTPAKNNSTMATTLMIEERKQILTEHFLKGEITVLSPSIYQIMDISNKPTIDKFGLLLMPIELEHLFVTVFISVVWAW